MEDSLQLWRRRISSFSARLPELRRFHSGLDPKVMNMNDDGSDEELGWMNPANDRKTPYTDEEIDTFVEDFIRGLEEQKWLSMTAEYGEEKARERIRAAIAKMDERNLANITPQGPVN